MANPLLALWHRILLDRDVDEPGRPPGPDELPDVFPPQASTGLLLVLRRMRVPLIVLIVVFAVGVLGLTLVPGEDSLGRPVRMGFLDAFYFMSYTATTIGFGEIPHPFTPAQRMWVTFAIFLSVIGWAYAIGSLFALMQDRAFRRALARQHFARKVAHLGEPFLILVGYGNATKRVARSLDDMGRRFVVLDRDENRVAAIDLEAYRADTPALLGDAHDTSRLAIAGLGHRHCEGVVALAGDDEANLDVTITTALLRPDLPVIARTRSRDVAEQMRLVGRTEVINPLDRVGDHLRILLRSPAAYQLMMWLTSAPGTEIPSRLARPPSGRWVLCGYPGIVGELAADLRAEGVEVSVFDSVHARPSREDHVGREPLDEADVEHAAAFVAATTSDTTNLWLVKAVRRANPDAFVVTMQNHAGNSPLFEAVGVAFEMVPDEVVAHEVLARLANPLLMDFLPQVPRQADGWATQVVDRMTERCGPRMPDLWRVRLTPAEVPAVAGWLRAGTLRLGDIVRSPVDREQPLDAVPLLLCRDGASVLTPEDGERLAPGDELLIAGGRAARLALDATLTHEPTAAYVVDGRFVPSSWVWRRLAGRGRPGPDERGVTDGSRP